MEEHTKNARNKKKKKPSTSTQLEIGGIKNEIMGFVGGIAIVDLLGTEIEVSFILFFFFLIMIFPSKLRYYHYYYCTFLDPLKYKKFNLLI